MKSESIKELACALSKAQGEISGAKKSSENPYFKSHYADLASCVDAIREPFAKNGLSWVQSCEWLEAGMVVETTLMHSSGEWLTTYTPPLRPVKDDPQSRIACTTYGRRNGLCFTAGLPQIDDDGNEISDRANSKLQDASKRVLGGAIPEIADVPPKEAQAMADEIKLVMEKDDSGMYLRDPTAAKAVHDRFNVPDKQIAYIAASVLVGPAMRNAFKARVNEARKNA